MSISKLHHGDAAFTAAFATARAAATFFDASYDSYVTDATDADPDVYWAFGGDVLRHYDGYVGTCIGYDLSSLDDPRYDTDDYELMQLLGGY